MRAQRTRRTAAAAQAYRLPPRRAGHRRRARVHGAVDCLLKCVRQEGVQSLWKGFLPYYMRLGPHTVLTFVILEQLNRAYDQQLVRG